MMQSIDLHLYLKCHSLKGVLHTNQLHDFSVSMRLAANGLINFVYVSWYFHQIFLKSKYFMYVCSYFN